MRRTVPERLNARAKPCTTKGCGCHGCLLIPATGRYAQIYVSGKRQLAHRVAWELEHGQIKPGLDIDHVYDRGCRHKNCVNVAHLEPVTRAENIRRMDRANGGREHQPYAERQPDDDSPVSPPSPASAMAARVMDEFMRGSR